MKTALIIVDMQNDFMPLGALPVPEGDKVIPIINGLLKYFDLIVATQDWHPADHHSFAINHLGNSPGDVVNMEGVQQILWPMHCVQHTKGAEFVEELAINCVHKIFQKGTDPKVDSYSGFFDNNYRKSTGLDVFLKAQNIQKVYVVGVATEYCVKYTALHANERGFMTYLIEDACRGVNLNSNDVKDAIAEMKHAGIHIIQSSELKKL